MTLSTVNYASQTDHPPMGLADLMTAPWALPLESHRDIGVICAKHLAGPKLDIKAEEKRLGFSLATPREDYQVDRGVAVIHIDGLIVPKVNFLTRVFGAVSAQWAMEQVKAAVSDPRVKAIVLCLDSPGGSVYGSPELAAAVCGAAKVKPLVAYSDAMLLSAAYWIGSAANAIYLSGPTVQAGSIGIVMTKKWEPEAEKNSTEVFAGRYKQYTSSIKKPTAQACNYLQSQVDYLYTVFVESVANFRGVTSDFAVERMAEGRIFIGQQAIDVGLADELMSLGALVNAMANNPSAFARRRRVVAKRTAHPAAAVASPKPISPLCRG